MTEQREPPTHVIRHRTGEKFGSSAPHGGAARPNHANITNVHLQRFLGASKIKNRGFDLEPMNQCLIAEGASSPAEVSSLRCIMSASVTHAEALSRFLFDSWQFRSGLFLMKPANVAVILGNYGMASENHPSRLKSGVINPVDPKSSRVFCPRRPRSQRRAQESRGRTENPAGLWASALNATKSLTACDILCPLPQYSFRLRNKRSISRWKRPWVNQSLL